MENINASLAFVINVHQRLVSEAPMTNYQSWCRHVHNSSLNCEEKWERILAWDLKPQDYENPTLFASDWQLKQLLSKLSFGGQPTERDKTRGYEKFLVAERRCKHHNHWMTTGSSPAFHALRHEMGKIVANVLGDINEFFAYVENADRRAVNSLVKQSKDRFARVETFSSLVEPEFGPGVGVGTKLSKLAGPTEKLLLGTVTSDCAYLGNWLSRLFSIPTASLAEGSVLTFVAKRVGEARTICYEPSMNMLVQKLIGRYLKHRLKVVLGIDLHCQLRNRNLARLGSLCDSWASEDMSSASDLWSYQFVLDQLPFPWFKLMDDCRSKKYFDPMSQNWNEFEKFSTMGNGFTFELETLLFFAAVKASVKHFDKVTLRNDEICVYGDDILFPKVHARTVEQALMLCGHLPNTEKSFHAGPFRESCGGDYFNGWDVTPVKIKEFDIDNPRQLIGLYNRLSLLSRHSDAVPRVQLRVRRALSFIKGRLNDLYASRVSSGPLEFVTNRLGQTLVESSDRWLYDDGTQNNVWSPDYCYILPKYVCEEVDVKLTDYHVHPLAVPYFTLYGNQVKNLVERKVRFKRNPMLTRKG